MALPPETMSRFNTYLTGQVVRSRPLRRELEEFTRQFQSDLEDQATLAELVGKIGQTLDDMLSRQNTRTTPLHVRMVQGVAQVFMRTNREGEDLGFDFDLEVLNETARTIRRPKLQISR
jgi:hypothetical protein